MKHLAFLSFLTLVICSASAQKVDLDKFSFTATYRDLPRIGLDTSYRTFVTTIEASPLLRYSLRDYKPDASIQIEGWKKYVIRSFWQSKRLLNL